MTTATNTPIQASADTPGSAACCSSLRDPPGTWQAWQSLLGRQRPQRGCPAVPRSRASGVADRNAPQSLGLLKGVYAVPFPAPHPAGNNHGPCAKQHSNDHGEDPDSKPSTLPENHQHDPGQAQSLRSDVQIQRTSQVLHASTVSPGTARRMPVPGRATRRSVNPPWPRSSEDLNRCRRKDTHRLGGPEPWTSGCGNWGNARGCAAEEAVAVNAAPPPYSDGHGKCHDFGEPAAINTGRNGQRLRGWSAPFVPLGQRSFRWRLWWLLR